MKFNTRAIHSGQEPDPATGAVIPPIYQTSTFAQEDAGIHKGYEYSRSGNPTRSMLEGVLAELEGGRQGFCFASGMGALTTLCLALFKSGDHLVVGDDVYGGTYRFLTKVFEKYGVAVDFVDMARLETVEQAIRPTTRLVYLETPTNPLLKLADLSAIVKIAQAKGIPTAVDNTFATPYLQTPLEHGVDIVLHSTTKYIGGHSDVVGGALILRDDTFRDAIRFHQNAVGATPDPFASWLTLRGLKTLGIRMKTHCESALALAGFLESYPAVEAVIYPGLSSHSQYELAQHQMKNGFGGMISLRVAGGETGARRFLKSLRYFTLAESLGGVESLSSHPARMTHLAVEKPIREALGITDDLVRLSVGIEDVDDLQADLIQALQAVSDAKMPA